MTSHSAPSVLVIQNDATGGPGRVGDWLTEAGLQQSVVHGYREPVPTRLDHDAIMVMGGGYLPDADERAGWLAPTRDLVSQALESGKPVLGICLGGQLLAHVGGGVVEGDVGAPEAGSTAMKLHVETAADDPLFSGLPEELAGMEHHVDAITKLPPEAELLASSDRCPYQAFRLGSCAWGFQFHPEMTPDRILNWDAEKLQGQGFERGQLYAKALADEATSTPIWRTVVDRFATVVKQAASGNS